MTIHVVQAGETLSSIAATYGVSQQRLQTDNGIFSEDGLVVGQALVVLFPSQIHTVAAGETIYTIARQYGIPSLTLLQNNPTLVQRPLVPGEMVVIRFRQERRGELFVNGYAYPNIPEDNLFTAVLYLTQLTIFGYGFTSAGALIPTPDDFLIRTAQSYDAAPVMLLSTITEEGHFDTAHATALMQDEAAQQTLIDNILQTMEQKGYTGLDIDFEFIDPAVAENYFRFLENVTRQLNVRGYTVNVDLAPKTSAEQTGLLYESHNYQRIGAIANTVLLMTYEWGYTYGPPMAVAPINKVKQVLDYALTEIPREKIVLGIPNYGYDWLLPFEQGLSKATTIGNRQAVRIAAEFGAEILYDEVAQSPHFHYRDREGREHEVWFEDARSIQAKLALAFDNQLFGVGYWNVMRAFPQNWALLNDLYQIQKFTA